MLNYRTLLKSHIYAEQLKKYDNLAKKIVTPKKLSNMIMYHINSKKSPGYKIPTGEIMKNCNRYAVVKLTTLINTTFRLKYVPDL